MRYLILSCFLASLSSLAADVPVPKKRSEPATVAKAIDQEITQRLSESNIPASNRCTDDEFLRRATLDITGTLPTVDRVKSFLAEKSSNKRAALIDELLADHNYGDYFASIWFDLLVQTNDDNRALIAKSFEPWLADKFNAQKGWDKIVGEILTAEGKRDENPATVFWLAQSDMNARPAHVKTADAVGKITQRFLGTQFQCAECHDHPFTPLRQQDFWGTAAFFGDVSLKDAQKKMLRADSVPSVFEKSAGKQFGMIEIPDSQKDSAKTQFPDGTPYDPASANGASLRGVFATWCTSRENEHFSNAMANRMWAHFLGRGFVMPVDDFRKNNAPSHPDALDALSKDFAASGYDLKHLIRCICLTQAYQRSSEATAQNKNDETLFSHAPLKMLSAGVLENALEESLGNEVAEAEAGTRAKGKGKGKAARMKKKAAKRQQIMGSKFEQAFATSEEPDDPEYSHGVPQVLQLMNGEDLIGSTLLTSVSRSGAVKDGIEHLYLATLSRMPHPRELTRMQSFIDSAASKTAGYHGVLWALLNSSEYVLNH